MKEILKYTGKFKYKLRNECGNKKKSLLFWEPVVESAKSNRLFGGKRKRDSKES